MLFIIHNIQRLIFFKIINKINITLLVLFLLTRKIPHEENVIDFD